MFRIIFYRNSVLASICSILGSAFVCMAIVSMYDGSLGILEGIGVILAGGGLVVLGSYISERKERKKQAKAAQAAQTPQSSRPAQAARPAQTAQTARPAQPAHPAMAAAAGPAQNGNPAAAPVGKAVGASPVFAGIFFLLSALLTLFLIVIDHHRISFGMPLVYHTPLACLLGCVLLGIGCFLTVKKQEISALHVLGFLLLICYGFMNYHISQWGSPYSLGHIFRLGGIKGLLSSYLFQELLIIVCFILMFIFAIFTLKGSRPQTGGIVRALWLIPALLTILLAFLTSNIQHAVRLILHSPSLLAERPGVVQVAQSFSRFLMLIAAAFVAFGFWRICKKSVTAPTAQSQPQYQQPQYQQPQYQQPQYQQAQPQPQYQQAQYQQAQPRPQAQPQYQQAQPQPQYQQAQPQPQYQQAQPQYQQAQPQSQPAMDPQEREKTIRAYRDLLECGILTQEEYDQKIREIGE